MADTRLLSLLVAVSLIGASAATSNDAQDRAGLQDLLSAMKRYLNAKDTSGRASAHDDVRTYYAKSTTESDVSAAEAAKTGYWTDWIDKDPLMDVGTGEFEDCGRIAYEQDKDKKCYLGCEAPIAYKYSVVAQSQATWADLEKCVGSMDTSSSRAKSCGFKCYNADARSADKSNCNRRQCDAFGLGSECARCPNVRVKFFCMGQPPDADSCCPYSTACSRRSRPSLRAALAKFGSDAEKRDVIANILHDVQDVLEPNN